MPFSCFLCSLNHTTPRLTANQEAATKILSNILEECNNGAVCVLEQFTNHIAEARKEVAFETALREKMATQLETYACHDKDSVTSDPIRRTNWKNWKVDVMHELPTSKIHLIEGFVDPEECKAILDVAEKATLGSATVAGGPKYSMARKALQTNVAIPWTQESNGHPIARVARRVYDYTNSVLEGLNIQEHGQSSFKYLHYSGRGRNDTEPDHYSAHCDGNW